MTPLDRMILAFENRRYIHASNKDADIQAEIGLTPTRYYQLLAALLSDPEALEAEPILVNRLRRISSRRINAPAEAF